MKVFVKGKVNKEPIEKSVSELEGISRNNFVGEKVVLIDTNEVGVITSADINNQYLIEINGKGRWKQSHEFRIIKAE